LLRVQPSPMLLYTVSPSHLPDWMLFCGYTCDLSRVTDFARCRLFAQLGHTFALSSSDRWQW